jgi:hypothetical protein
MKIICPLLIFITLSCQSVVKDPVRASIEAYLIPKMDDPASYEFVSLMVLDTVTTGELLSWLSEPDKTYTDLVDIRRDSIKVAAVNGLKATVNLAKPLHYHYELVFRGKNKLGALVLNTLYVQLDPDTLAIEQVSEGIGMSANPSKIPGHDQALNIL